MNKNILFLFLIISTSVYSYTPTAESLFRNGSNPDIGNSTVVGTLKIEKKLGEDVELDNQELRSAVKILVGNEETGRKFIQFFIVIIKFTISITFKSVPNSSPVN